MYKAVSSVGLLYVTYTCAGYLDKYSTIINFHIRRHEWPSGYVRGLSCGRLRFQAPGLAPTGKLSCSPSSKWVPVGTKVYDTGIIVIGVKRL